MFFKYKIKNFFSFFGYNLIKSKPGKQHTGFEINPVVQDKEKEIRYSKKIEFNDQIVNEYFNKEINLNSKKFDNSLLKEPYFFNN